MTALGLSVLGAASFLGGIAVVLLRLMSMGWEPFWTSHDALTRTLFVVGAILSALGLLAMKFASRVHPPPRGELRERKKLSRSY
ncbi:MAG: hypothetical protein ACREPX_03955 [Rhodanobacteraceae bacterium]